MKPAQRPRSWRPALGLARSALAFGGLLAVGGALRCPLAAAAPTRGLGPAAVEGPAAPAAEGRQIALLIGVERYADPSVPPLSTPGRDVEALGAALRGRFGFDQVVVLRDAEATRAGVLGALAALGPLGPTDALLVYWAGHGATTFGPDGVAQGFLVPYDSPLAPEALPTRALSMAELRGLLAGAGAAGHRFIVVDACFAGLLALRGPSALEPHTLAYLERARRLPSLQVLTAGGADQPVLDAGPDGHSVFASAVLEALDAPFDYLSASELSVQVQLQVQRRAFELGAHAQSPEFAKLSGGGEFLFVPIGSPAVAGPAARQAAALQARRRSLGRGAIGAGAVGAVGLLTSALSHAVYVDAPLSAGPMPGLYQLNRASAAVGAGGLSAAAGLLVLRLRLQPPAVHSP